MTYYTVFFLKSVLPPLHCHSNRPDFGKIVAPNETSLFWSQFAKLSQVYNIDTHPMILCCQDVNEKI